MKSKTTGNCSRLHRACMIWLAITFLIFCGGNRPSVAKEPHGEPHLESILVHPQQFVVRGRREQLQLTVTGRTADGQSIDVTRSVQYAVDPDKAIVNDRGVVIPKADGDYAVRISLGDASAETQIVAQEISQPQAVSFDYHALPVLAQAGCSGGSCHGAPHGKAGFRLSLFGSDRELDRASLTREFFGRRINPIEPTKSLLLKKPTMQIAHQGGKRLDTEDLQYKLLLDWIAEGCRTDHVGPQCIGIKVYPEDGRLWKFPHSQQQLSVIAQFEDGASRDVTHLAKYEASDPQVADVDQSGLVTGLDRGETAVIVRYLNYIETPLMTFVRDIEDFAWKSPAPAGEIDEHVYAKLKQLQFLPSAIADDRVFVRRVFLDTIGVLPTEQEIHAFVNEPRDDKRSRLIDALLERPEYAKFWSQKWGDLLRVSTKLIGVASVHKFSRWIENSIRANQPYDEFAREILLASGSTRLSPAGNFYRSAGNTSDAMETSAQVFLGTRIQCAKCHNHPFERWTQENYYGLSAFFSRLQRTKTARKEEVLLWSQVEGEVQNPATGQTAAPWVPVDGKLPAEQADRRRSFATWLTSPDNPLFAKIEVNRIWAQLMGRGIVEPFDDFRDSNPAANSPLLESLANSFVQSGYDRRHVIRLILNSNTYQASSATNPFNEEDTKYFSHYMPRMLTAEQLVDALGSVTGKPQQFFGVPTETKATWLPAPDLKPHDRAKIGDIEFLKVFGQPERQSACECERSDDVSLGQALELLNGKTVAGMLSDKSNFIHRQLNENADPNTIIKQLYIRAICRPPTDIEQAIHQKYLDGHEDLSTAMEDICWAILNRNEFLFQH